MALTVTHIPLVLGQVVPPRVAFRFRVLREGEVSAGEKRVLFFRSFAQVGQVSIAFETVGGEFTRYESIQQQTLNDQGEWLVIGYDDTAPRKIRAAYLTIGAAGTYTFNITSGDGGASGDRAALSARVRVEGAAVAREVLVVEKPSSGQWRVAGYGPVNDGDGTIDVRVTDGDCYAIGLDEWGVDFAPSLPVTEGQVVRPSVFLGWVYRITQTGVLPAVEPEWWDDSLEGPQQLGTARAVVRRYYQPIAHGPLRIEGE
ncbi:hypothetical protein ABKS89_30405 [Pseudomonas sp. LABIM340]|uniref:hypothetical protein n=1 Tax=Pseudomonas sp. LABIM340 TaxID=3156585 RepID=UPI0032AEBCF1